MGANAMSGLPPGFQLDQPKLPDGFVLDTPQAAQNASSQGKTPQPDNPDSNNEDQSLLSHIYQWAKNRVSSNFQNMTNDVSNVIAGSASPETRSAMGLPEPTPEQLQQSGQNLTVGVAGSLGPGIGGRIPTKDITKLQSLGMDTSKLNPTKVIAKPGFVEEKLYKSATKPSTILTQEEKNAQINTALNKGINVTRGGLDKIKRLLSTNKQQVDNIINTATENGDTIPTKAILDSIDNVSSVYENAPIPGPYLDEITKAKEAIAAQWGDNIPVNVAQDMKRLVGKLQSKAYDRLKTINPATPQLNPDIEKAIYSGIQKQLEVQYPQLATLNADSSALLSLNKTLIRSVNRISSKDIFGLGAFIHFGTGYAVGHAIAGPPGGYTGAVVGAILELPAVKSAMAIALRAAKVAPKQTYIQPIMPVAGSLAQNRQLQ